MSHPPLLSEAPLISRREAKSSGDRDVFNERPTREDQTLTVAPVEEKAALATSCTIHTSMGDIVSVLEYSSLELLIKLPCQRLKLFPDIAPKTVENFAGHARSGE